MTEVRRINAENGFISEFVEYRDRVKSLETAPAGNMVIRETLTTEDPETGVKTILGQLPDGSYGLQPFVYDITPPPVATAPVVVSEPGLFIISWDGFFAGLAAMPRDFECCNIIGHKIVDGATVSSAPVGMTRRPLDITYISTDVAKGGETWQFSLEAEDYNGNRAEWSARSAPLVMQDVLANVDVALTDLQTEVDAANAAASNAQAAAAAADSKAVQAASDALAASNLAGTKGKVLIQPTAPTGSDANTQTLWIDTTAGVNTPKKWVSGTTWTAVTDKAATDAASAAVAAQTRADQAFNSATSAATAAGNAQTSADSKNKIWYQTTAPAGTGHKAGDTWFDTDDGNRIYIWTGAAWTDHRDAGIAAAQTAANTALTSANGKNKNYYQTTMPSGGTYILGDTWFDTDDGNKIYNYNGTTFVAAPLGANAIADQAITNAKIADATIQSAKIGSVDAGTISVGTVGADRIGANSITADKLLISRGANLFTDPMIRDSAGWADSPFFTATGGKNGGGSISIPMGATQNGLYYAQVASLSNRRTLLVPGGTYRIAGWVKTSSAAPSGSLQVYLRYQNEGSAVGAIASNIVTDIPYNKVATVADTWTFVSGMVTIPESTTYTTGVLGVFKQSTYTTGTTIWSDLSIQQAMAGELIVDGAITTGHMTSGTIDAGILSAGSIKSPMIEAKSIGVDRLTITSTDNLVVGGDMALSAASWGKNATITAQPTAGRGAMPALRFGGFTGAQASTNAANKVTVEPDNKFRCSIFVKSSSALAIDRVRLMIRCFTSATVSSDVIGVYNTAPLVANTWTQVEGISATLPANTLFVEFYLYVTNPDTTTTTDIDYVSATRAFDGNLVVDGAIDGQTITGATVRTAASGARIELNSAGLYGWNAAGVNYLVADSTGISLTGKLSATGSGRNATNTADRDIQIVVGDSAQRRGGAQTEQWPPPPADSGIPTPGLSFKPVGITMLSYAGLSSSDGYGISLSAGYSTENSSGLKPSSLLLGQASASITSTLNVAGVVKTEYSNAAQKRVPTGIITRLIQPASIQFGTTDTVILTGTALLRGGSLVRLYAHIHCYAQYNATYAGYNLRVNGVSVESYTKPYAIGGYGDTTVFSGIYQVPATTNVYTLTITGQVVVGPGGTFVGSGGNSIKLIVEDVGD